MGGCIEKICNADQENAKKLDAKGKYARLSAQMSLLVKQTSQDNDEFFTDNIWWKKNESTFLVPEKFVYMYPNYKEDQDALEALWKRIDLDNLMKKNFKRLKNEALLYQWKYIIRKGVPFSKMRIIILEMFKKTYNNNDLEYESAVQVCFQDQVPTSFKNVCSFTDEEKLEDTLKIHFLSDEGIYALKKILWIFRKGFPKLEYSPMLPQSLALLLLVLSESETYTVTKLMLEESVRLLDESHQYKAEEMKGLRWHFVLNKEDFEKFIKSFYNYVKLKSKAFVLIDKHLNKINYNYIELFKDWFKNLFFGFLPLPIIIKIFVTYLNEGIKIYYRMGYALLRTFKSDVLKHTDPDTLTELLKEKSNNITPAQLKKMMKKAYALPLSALDHRFSKVRVEGDDLNSTNVFYLPYIASPSAIINNQQFETLWEWLPKEHKLSDPTLVYSSTKDGWSLKTLYNKTEDYEDYCMYLLIKTSKGIIFGAFLDRVFHLDWTGTKTIGTNESFVFQLYPKEIKYPSSGKNNQHLVCSADNFTIGIGGDGSAIYLDGELLNGQTYKCETYNNQQLNNQASKNEASFQCQALEVYVF